MSDARGTNVPVTRKMLEDWSGVRVFREAMQLFKRGAVSHVEYAAPCICGTIEIGSRTMKSSVEILPDGSAENRCPCHASRERGVICSHVIALGLALVREAHDPDRERKQREEQRKAARIAAVEQGILIRRASEDDPGAVPLRLHLGPVPGWQEKLHTQSLVPIRCLAEVGDRYLPLDQTPRGSAYHLTEEDEAILFVLEDICEGVVGSDLEVSARDFINLLELYRGRSLWGPDESALTVNAAALSSRLRVDLDRENGELLVMIHTEMPFLPAGEFPVYILGRRRGWVFGADHFWPLETLLPEPLHAIYRDPMVIDRGSVPRFMETELPLLAGQMPVETDLSADLFTIDPAMPRFRMVIRGSPAALAPTVYAEYNEIRLVAGKAAPEGLFALPDPKDLMRYMVRNLDREVIALAGLASLGIEGTEGDDLGPITGTRNVMNFLGRDLPALRRSGWRVEFQGRIEETVRDLDFVTPVVRVNQSGSTWFDVQFSYEETGGSSLTSTEIQRALRRGDHFVEKAGTTWLLDGGAIEAMHEVFRDCASSDGDAPGSFRMDTIHAAYVQSSLDALDGIDVEAGATWPKLTGERNRTTPLEPVEVPSEVTATLRPYQREGVSWLTFLERNGFGGILADEMGLGKTVQTLAWLRRARAHAEVSGRPSLIVCPTSLVENWAEEAARFVPDLNVLVISGAKRKERWNEVPDADLVVTSYALLRRDVDAYASTDFASAVLDEAQHIKNATTLNAKAVKQIRAYHRLVLTGTPVENGVSDLWSIMDFLMPNYLGPHARFRENYELPISRGGRDAEDAQARLRRKVHPFLLRRLKKDVAKDLPPKIQRIARFTMSADQKKVYQEILQASQRKLIGMVAKKGFQSSRMEILKTLLRLRQICCHLDLLKLDGMEANAPSAKLDLFLELLDEALDGGHRVLVFSQFVSMLQILKTELEMRGLAFCYLDGATRNRMEQVRTFNTRREIPVFLISLKAGGTGLNLTGADMVIHFDPWWNPAVEDQATDRAYRIGQQRTVYSIKLIARDSVEEKVLELQRKKKAIIDATIATDDQAMQAMDWDDIRELLEM